MLEPETEHPLWELFHENSKLSQFVNRPTDHAVENAVSDLYESLPFNGYPTFPLPDRLPSMKMPVRKAMHSRVTAHEMTPHPLRCDQLAALLHFGYGVTRDNHSSRWLRSFRVVPSAGALYPIEIFIHINKVQGIPPGLFHYNPLKRNLRYLREQGKNEITRCFVQKTIPLQASILIFLTALFERSTFKYGNRGYRFTLIEAGHIAQNINLTSTALSLGCKNIGGFYDREIDAYLQLDGIFHSTIYAIAIGVKRRGRVRTRPH